MTGGGPPSYTVGMPGAGCSFVPCERHKAMVDVRCQQCLLATLLCTATLPWRDVDCRRPLMGPDLSGGMHPNEGVHADIAWCIEFAYTMLPTEGDATRLELVWRAVQAVLYMKAYMDASAT